MSTVRQTYEQIRETLLAARDPDTGVWTGGLASSALGTALAVGAFASGSDPDRFLAIRGAEWLAAHANSDGGWGDTPESPSNLSATVIAAASLRCCLSAVGDRRLEGIPACLSRADGWVEERAGSLQVEDVARILARVYGQDRTFVVPILAFLAMCGGGGRAWLRVPPLPFLLALLPHSFYRFARLPVVSYALPALIAVGLCRQIGVARVRKRWEWGRVFAGALLRRLARLQPEHGGFLDAIPLTAFVCLALQHVGYGENVVVQKGLAFLRGAVRADGSWAIDSNLRTWLTSLAVRALTAGPRGRAFGVLWRSELEAVGSWLLEAQIKTRHPFTGAAPGGWAWTDLPGGVPDADDTAAALIALKHLWDAGVRVSGLMPTVRRGIVWLLDLQNRDGGIPTFCKGWGRLPFDRSCPDISAHVLAAFAVWRLKAGSVGLRPHDCRRLDVAMTRLAEYLAHEQLEDGSWLPLWFGHQASADGRNPVVGTARVVDALRRARRELGDQRDRLTARSLSRGERWLLAAQQAGGGWGAGRHATVEETALTVMALTGGEPEDLAEAVKRGCAWLVAHGGGIGEPPAPIGLYFTVLWYHEDLYRLIWAAEALGLQGEQEPSSQVTVFGLRKKACRARSNR